MAWTPVRHQGRTGIHATRSGSISATTTEPGGRRRAERARCSQGPAHRPARGGAAVRGVGRRRRAVPHGGLAVVHHEDAVDPQFERPVPSPPQHQFPRSPPPARPPHLPIFPKPLASEELRAMAHGSSDAKNGFSTGRRGGRGGVGRGKFSVWETVDVQGTYGVGVPTVPRGGTGATRRIARELAARKEASFRGINWWLGLSPAGRWRSSEPGGGEPTTGKRSRPIPAS